LKILVPVDGSPEAAKALDLAISLAKAYGAPLGMIHVVQLPTAWSLSTAWRLPTPASYDTVRDQQQTYRKAVEIIETNGKNILEIAEEKAEAAGLKTEKILESGHAADQIVTAASERGYDLIVIGDRGNSGVKEALLGSVSTHVSQHAKCSVLIVR
jgi:nucleotide-binding universal stress UspA family protein